MVTSRQIRSGGDRKKQWKKKKEGRKIQRFLSVHSIEQVTLILYINGREYFLFPVSQRKIRIEGWWCRRQVKKQLKMENL